MITIVGVDQNIVDRANRGETLTETEARMVVAGMTTPALTAFRARVPAMATSQLVGILAGNDELLDAIAESIGVDDDTPEADTKGLLAAAFLAVSDELDARIPPRAVDGKDTL